MKAILGPRALRKAYRDKFGRAISSSDMVSFYLMCWMYGVKPVGTLDEIIGEKWPAGRARLYEKFKR